MIDHFVITSQTKNPSVITAGGSFLFSSLTSRLTKLTSMMMQLTKGLPRVSPRVSFCVNLWTPMETETADSALYTLILCIPMETYGTVCNSTSPAPYKLPIWPCK